MVWPVEEQYVTAAEDALSVSFPRAYRVELQRRNGGEVEVDDCRWGLHPVWDQSDRKRLARTANDVVRETRWLRREVRHFPERAVAIGKAETGDRLILLPADGEQGPLDDVVSAWAHDTGEVRAVCSVDELFSFRTY